MSHALAAQVWASALSPVEQEHLLEARQMQALSFAVHIPSSASASRFRAVLAIGVITLAAIVVVGVAELLRPEVLGWAGTPGEAPNAASARNQGSPDANAALGRGK